MTLSRCGGVGTSVPAVAAALLLPLNPPTVAAQGAPAAVAAAEDQSLPEIEVTQPEQTKYPSQKPAQKKAAPSSSAATVQASTPQQDASGSSEAEAAVSNAASTALPSIANVGTIVGAGGDVRSLTGSANVVTGQELYTSHVFTTNEALKKVPGVNVRDEEGFGIRPNIGIRGLNPTRSTKTLLLEDGQFLTYAPYGDNASYFHPSLDRFEHVEVIKGADQLLYGPQTISGTVNYVTPNPPAEPGGFVAATGGSRDYFNGQVFYGGWWGPFGGLIDYVHKEGDGARDNTHHEIEDAGVKGIYEITPGSNLIAKVSYFREDSQVTYSGITDAEMRNFGTRYNPFKNDEFDTERIGTSLTHDWDLNANVSVATTVYWTTFDREWWRQSSQTLDTQCGNAFRNDRLAGNAVDPDSCNQRQGRLRDYETTGLEQRWEFRNQLADDISNRLRVGFRVHGEDQERLQINSFSPFNEPGLGQAVPGSGNATAAVPARLVEYNDRQAFAVSTFAQNRFEIGAFSITPAVRYENVEYTRTNLLATAICEDGSPAPCRGKSEITEVIPGISFGLAAMTGLDFFAGVHEGFAPPRVEDSIANNGGSIELGPESSTNFEAGLKSELVAGLKVDATYFRNDFDNLIAVGSVAGGGQPLAQGEALFEGLELLVRADSEKLLNTSYNLYSQVAWTYLWDAKQSTPFVPVPVPGSPLVPTPDTAGNRQPYAPEHLVTARIGIAQPGLFDVHLEMVYVGEQFADFLSLETGADHPNGPGSLEALSGQFGEIDAYTIFNLGATYTLKDYETDVYLAVKNLFDEEYIVDRTRGILPGAPRLIHVGLKKSF